ncbi:hypothetical protein DLS49_13775, partial [Staphylococcus pseudintermedius]
MVELDALRTVQTTGLDGLQEASPAECAHGLWLLGQLVERLSAGPDNSLRTSCLGALYQLVDFDGRAGLEFCVAPDAAGIAGVLGFAALQPDEERSLTSSCSLALERVERLGYIQRHVPPKLFSSRLCP